MTEEIKQKDHDIVDQIPETMKPGKKYTTKKLARELAGGKKGMQYTKQRLHIHREWFPRQVEDLETFKEDDSTGGEKTRYWRIKK